MTLGERLGALRRRLGLLTKAASAVALGCVVTSLFAANAVAADANHLAVAPGGYTPMAPTPGKGMPVDGGTTFQTQYSATGLEALWMHDNIVMVVLIAVSIFVAALLIWVMVRYNARANPVPSKTSHNTLLEVIWTGIPVLILLVVFVPSMKLLAHQYKTPPKDAVTIKAIGNQWYWTYAYPDNGGFEVTSNMLSKEEAKKRGEPEQLAADYRMVVPAGEPIRLQTFGADVIHSFAVPSLWFKLDAVPGRINEKLLTVKEPGVYYGQCSELCGARHGYMPIVVEALPRPQYNAWVLTHAGGKIDGAPESAAAPAAEAAASEAPAVAAASGE
ncbi:cytochrome c oxidase subunit II [Novosphingobium umbonatum]|uniref:Cytochrome c oxidase subunit 2 n=1 Tax=Novosphingobium umbonatum TaxID=1908524 RepID=A0A437NAZ8_9SPHN|nr:cytochrome c oxidase subunit II [Novosphingobium umbonatum]RVU07124.1 cytochrome c oxidase subunit II [Novosphingobium umbonatum]